MPDDTTNQNPNNFDQEPATGTARPDTTEHADLDHRIEADTHDEPSVAPAPTPAFRPAPERPVAPLPAPVGQTAAPKPESDLPNPGPGLMVLQWLVYALWGWTVLALSGLVSLVVTQLVSGNDSDGLFSWYGDGISYLLAAVIVLFIISLICDVFYAKAEQKHAHTTGTNVIMIIHAVIFALFGIGALISSVFGGVRLMIGDTNDASEAVAGIISGGIIFVLYGLTLLRTLRPRWISGVVPMFWLFMTTAIIISVIMGIMGPAAQARLRAQDEIIENSLPTLAEAINTHATTNGSLPRDLSELTDLNEYGSDDEVRRLIDEDLVEYKPGQKLSTAATQNLNSFQFGVDQQGGATGPIYHYQLCVDYKTSNGDDDSYPADSRKMDGQRYPTSISTYGHPAGNKCYDVQTDYSY